MDHSYSFLVEVAGQRILNWCSERADGAPPADVLFMRPYVTPGACERLLNDVRPRLVVPVHWDSFLRPLSRPLRPMLNPRPRRKGLLLERVDLTEFQQTTEAALPGVTVLVPEVLATYAL